MTSPNIYDILLEQMASNYSIKSYFHCIVCHGDFDYRNTVLVSQEKSKAVFHVTCSHCHTAILFVLVYRGKNAEGFSIITDLDREEVRTKFIDKAISSDEVIEAYKEIYYS